MRPTDEKSRSDWAELADMQNTRRAVVDIVGNCSALSRQNVSGLLSAAGWTCSALYWASSAALSARRAEAPAVRSWQSRSSSKGSRRGLLCCGLAVEVDCLIHNNSSVPVNANEAQFHTSKSPACVKEYPEAGACELTWTLTQRCKVINTTSTRVIDSDHYQ